MGMVSLFNGFFRFRILSHFLILYHWISLKLVVYLYRSDNKDYALKLIEGTGYSQSFSLSACREVAVSLFILVSVWA